MGNSGLITHFICQNFTPPNLEPRKFKEKKERYGRDPKKLFETYQEEWDRLERLGMQLGPRRKSVLTLGVLGKQGTSIDRESGGGGTTPHTPVHKEYEPYEPQ